LISFQSMYELIVVGKVEGAVSLFERVEKFLKEASAENVKGEKMGKKTLAYPIAKSTEGEYFLFNFDAAGAEILGIDRKLKLEQAEVLRYLLIKTKPVRESKRQRVKGVKVESKSEEKEELKVEVKPKVTVTTKVMASKKVADPVKSKAVKKGTSKKD